MKYRVKKGERGELANTEWDEMRWDEMRWVVPYSVFENPLSNNGDDNEDEGIALMGSEWEEEEDEAEVEGGEGRRALENTNWTGISPG